MKVLQSFETLMPVYQWMQCNVPEYWNVLCVNTAVRTSDGAVYQALSLCGCCAVTLLTYRMSVECEEEQNNGRATDGAWFIARGN